MSPLFLSRDEKAAARSEARRLRELPPSDLAVEIMRAVAALEAAPTGKVAFLAGDVEMLRICYWLMRAHRRGYRQLRRLQKPVIQSLHLLEDAGLIENQRTWAKVGARGAILRTTVLGQTPLAEGSVQRCLASASKETGHDERPLPQS